MSISKSFVKETALSVGALLGVTCFVLAACAIFLGITPLVFRSGSMSPTIETGSLALARKVPATSLAVGDIVSVNRLDGSRITHRVADIVGSSGNSVTLLLKGDANADVDSERYVATEADRIFAHVPYGGYVATWTTTPFAWALGFVLVAGLLYVAWRPEPTGVRQPDGRHSVVAGVALVAVSAIVIAVGFARSDMTAAALTDTATAQTGNITAGTLANPTGLECTGGGVLATSVTLRIPRPTAPVTGYQVVVRNAAGTTSSAAMAFTVPTTGPATAVVNSGLLGSLLGGTAYADVRTTNGRWVSAGRQTQTINSLLGTSCVGTATATANRQAPVAAPSTGPTTSATSSATSSTEAPPTTSEAPSATISTTTTAPAPTTTTVAPTTTTTTAPAPPAVERPAPAQPTTTTTTPPPPVDLISPQSSPSGSSVAKVVSVDGSPTLQITDSSGAVQYSAPASSDSQYGYGVAWASGDQLWLLGTDQLVRLDSTGSGWSRSVVDPSATDQIPAEIAARMN